MSRQMDASTRSRLPDLQPNQNKKAQKILANHMHNMSTSTFKSSTAAVPVLQQIDSTASRTARTHDISHLRDRSSHLTPKIPPSQIPAEDHIYEKSFLPKDGASEYKEEDGLWHTKVFPSICPSSRTDAIMLDAWITKSLERYSEHVSEKDDLAQAVEELVPILSVALHEIVRQVIHYCAERGVVLEKIWRTYVELFDRVLREMKSSLKTHKEKTAEVQTVLNEACKNLDDLRSSHPVQMQKVIVDLEGKFTTRQKELELELRGRESENLVLTQELRDHHQLLECWYPSFHLYQNSYIKGQIPQFSMDRTGGDARNSTRPNRRVSLTLQNQKEDLTPEVAMAEDFKRLLSALAPDKRKAIGKELASLLSAQAANKGKSQRKEGPDDEAKVQQLLSEISDQDDYIRELEAEIAKLEGGETASP
eukprot:gnl/MRDRNA2_/MRDRNA2_115113_c0_seq1.p1 gnl/MRDRNA2_/MRDRNA2_115113_c0~~gnl/MRDRNA2_/MRDRNA2_115113_c0_seq1.p1  ORF type:complete len:422 (+),score=92.48 gnl/MRDRNA2_/MRDRNA2_115113_c0_seq1:122-1387(+)